MPRLSRGLEMDSPAGRRKRPGPGAQARSPVGGYGNDWVSNTSQAVAATFADGFE